MLGWVAVLPTWGCGASVDRSADGTGSEEPDSATSLTFVPGDVLRLLPLEQVELSVAAGPPGQYPVRFALLPDRPNAAPNDASLNRAETVTDSRGVATISLTAPSTPSTFTVRAAIGELESHLPVSVSRGYGEIVAEPVYVGTRTIEQWVASVRIGSSCGDLVGFPPPDGALVAKSDPDELPVLENVPVGAIASVSVRSGQFAYGCTNVPDLGADESRTVRVEVADRPMQLDGELPLSLSFDEPGPEWEALLENAMADGLSAFRNGAANDAEMLLDDMGQLIPAPDPEVPDMPPADVFADNRTTLDFDGVLATLFEDQDIALRDRVQTWMRAGVESLGPLQGELELRSSSALFRLLSAAGVPAGESGFIGTATWSAFADPGDTLVLGGSLRFDAIHWVTSLADAPARVQFQEAADTAEALILAAECSLIASTLATEAGGEIYPGCDAPCGANLCEAALVTAWTRASDAGGELTRLSIALTGIAQVDDDAVPRGLEGTWLGTLAGPSSAVGGAARAGAGEADQDATADDDSGAP